MKKIFMAAVLALGSLITVGAQTIEELPIDKTQDAPEFKITYPNGKVAYVDLHKLYPPKGTMTVGFVAGFDPMQNDQFKENAAKLGWNTGPAVSAFRTHFVTHAADLGISEQRARSLVDDIYLRSLQRLGL